MQWGIKLIVVITSIITIFSFLFWIVFYSVSFANQPSIISLRSWYQYTFWSTKDIFLEKENSAIPFEPVYTFQVQKWMDTNVYTFYGKFVSIDTLQQIIYLQGYDSKTYTFRVSNEFIKRQGYFDFVGINYAPNQDIVNIDNLPFTENSKIKIFWDDSRTLKQIMSDYSENPSEPLNFISGSNRFFSLTKRG